MKTNVRSEVSSEEITWKHRLHDRIILNGVLRMQVEWNRSAW